MTQRKNSSAGTSHAVNFTELAIDRLTCPPDKKQEFLRDSKAPGLKVRATAGGKKAFVFEAKLRRKTIRKTIGDVRSWSIQEARKEANRLRVLIDNGCDPREVERKQEEEQAVAKARQKTESTTVAELWKFYLTERRSLWSENHYRDHLAMAREGGLPRKRWKGKVTKDGPLVGLMQHRAADVDVDLLVSWAKKESSLRPSSTRLAMRQFKAFWHWAAEQKHLRAVMDVNAVNSKRLQEAVGRQRPRRDHLQRDQLEVWFCHVQKIPNPVISAYLQCLLLTGARREELARLRWQDVNERWSGLTIGDKIEGSRSIPLTPYVHILINNLPRRNEWVFSSLGSESGRLIEPTKAHFQACSAAGVEVTLHGLRRSFKSLTEWLEVPVGVVAQIMGHKPSATAERHYTVRPLDMLRLHHGRIEEWILEQGGVLYDPTALAGPLRIVESQPPAGAISTT
jgi:integrase